VTWLSGLVCLVFVVRALLWIVFEISSQL